MLLPEHEDAWLDPDLTEAESLQVMLRRYPAHEMEASE